MRWGSATSASPTGSTPGSCGGCGRWSPLTDRCPSHSAPLDDWLHAHLPPESATSIVHNDFRIGNMIVDIGAGCVAAVLDWELATIGDPLADLGYLLTSYPVAGEPLVPTLCDGHRGAGAGYPSRAELLDRYADRTGADVSGVNWYAALAMYKLAALYEYSRRRFEDGVGRPLLRQTGVGDFVPGRRRTAGRR